MPAGPTSVRATPRPRAAPTTIATSSSTTASRPRTGAWRGRMNGGGVVGAGDMMAIGPRRRLAAAAGGHQMLALPTAPHERPVRRPVPGQGGSWRRSLRRRGVHADRAGGVPRHRRARPRRSRAAPPVRRDQPRPVDRRDTDPLRPPRQPLLPGAVARRGHRAGHRPRRWHDRRRPGVPRRARHRHHEPRRPGHGAGVRAHRRGAARRRPPAARARRRPPPGSSSPSPA